MYTSRMKLFPSVITAIIVTLLVAGSVQAQPDNRRDRKGGPPSAEAKLARMTEHLGLNEEQSADMLLVLQQDERQRQELRDQIVADYKPSLCAQKDETRVAIMAILDEEQAEVFAARAEQSGGKGRGKGKRSGGSGFDVDCQSSDGQ